MDLEENPFDIEQEEIDEDGCELVQKPQVQDQVMQDEAPKDTLLKNVKYTDTSKILKKENPQEKFRLTHSEYEEITRRLEDSKSQVDLIRDALSSKANLLALREKIEAQCEKLTLRANILTFQEQKTSNLQPGVVTDVYKVELTDIVPCKKAYLLLKYNKSKNLKVDENANYLIDKIKIVVNNKGKIVLVSSGLTVMIQYQMFKATDENSLEVDSDEDYHYIDGQNKTDEHLAHEADMKRREEKEMAEYTRNRDGHSKTYQDDNKDSWAGQPRAGISHIFSNLSISAGKPNLDELKVLSSTKQIIQQASEILLDLNNSDAGPENSKSSKLWSFKDLLSWRIPENLSSNQNISRSRVEAEYLPPPINLYKFNLVTQRIKEQKANFCGIVTHVKQGNWSKKDQEKVDPNKLVTSQIDMESIDDKSKICLFIKHDPSVELKDFVLKNQVVLVRNALRKISNNLDIYVQLQLFSMNLKVIGKVNEEVNDFAANNTIQLLKTIPSDNIIRHIIKVCGFIVDINFIKIQYKCDVCKAEINNENVCRNGCFIKQPMLNLQVLCIVQDGTTKASLELKNDKVLKAFNVSEANQQKFKDYCLKYGTFMNPSSAQNFHYKDIVSVFKKYDIWSQMIFYCKPYCKVQNSMDKKQAAQNQFGGAAGGYSYSNYQETVSRPAFIAQEKVKDTEVFLNGEVNNFKRKGTANEKTIKKTMICLKALMVDHQLGREAVKNYYNLTKVE